MGDVLIKVACVVSIDDRIGTLRMGDVAIEGREMADVADESALKHAVAGIERALEEVAAIAG